MKNNNISFLVDYATKIVYTIFVKIQITIPHKVGNTKLRTVHFIEAVSFLIVSKVVVQGK